MIFLSLHTNPVYLNYHFFLLKMPVLLISDHHNPNILPSLEALQDIADSAPEPPRKAPSDEQPIPLKRPREFVETILTFLSRLQTISV